MSNQTAKQHQKYALSWRIAAVCAILIPLALIVLTYATVGLIGGLLLTPGLLSAVATAGFFNEQAKMESTRAYEVDNVVKKVALSPPSVRHSVKAVQASRPQETAKPPVLHQRPAAGTASCWGFFARCFVRTESVRPDEPRRESNFRL